MEEFLVFLAQAIKIPTVVSALDPTPAMLPAGQVYYLAKHASELSKKDEKNGNE